MSTQEAKFLLGLQLRASITMRIVRGGDVCIVQHSTSDACILQYSTGAAL